MSWVAAKNLDIGRNCREICGVLELVCGVEGKGAARMGSGIPTVSKNDGVGDVNLGLASANRHPANTDAAPNDNSSTSDWQST